MKRVILMRHGDAQSTSGGGDHARALTPQGIWQAQIMGRFLARSDRLPDKAMVSSAVRAVTTFENLRAAASRDIESRVIDALYAAPPSTVLTELMAVREAECVLVVAHQPTLGMLASQLIGGGQINFPTAGTLCVGFAISDWSELSLGNGWMLWQLAPAVVSELL